MGTPNWVNQTMWTADNLHVMRGMNSESIDLIYLDPPFNSNHDYSAPIGSEAAGAAFKDTWSLNDLDIAWMMDFEKNNPEVIRVIRAATTDSDMAYLVYMIPRLLEMHRILKHTGSVYLHCDPTMSHYLKVLMDVVFGRQNFRSDVIWRRKNAKGLSFRGFSNNADSILYYSKTDEFVWNRPYVPHSQDYVSKFYKYVEEGTGRRYRLSDLTNPNKNRPNLTYEFLGVTRVWRWTKERMQQAYANGLIVQANPGSVPSYKRYLDEMKGVPVDTIWNDIKAIQAQSKERTGYPTQKPIALLDRIIRASSNEGDIVLDPFCGCATACVAAENNNRKWVGIDVSAKAYTLVKRRIQATGGLFYDIVSRTDIPKRTDLGKLPPYNSKNNKNHLYGEQGGICAGCHEHFQSVNLTVDHIIAKKVGGTDHLSNLQLLCGYCNSVKGTKGMNFLMHKLGSEGSSKPYYKYGIPHYPSDMMYVSDMQNKINEPY